MTFWVAGAAVVGAGASIYSANKAADAASEGADASIAFQRESRDLANAYQQPYREAGYTALDALMGLSGLSSPASVRSAASGNAPGGALDLNAAQQIGAGIDPVLQSYRDVLGRNPDAGGYQYYTQLMNEKGLRLDDLNAFHRNSAEYEQRKAAGTLPPSELGGEFSQNYQPKAWEKSAPGTEGGGAAQTAAPRQSPGDMVRADPGYQFRLDEGQRALERGAAARGGLLSGGFARKHTRYAQDYASNEYMNVYNRISNIAGLGQVASGYSSQTAMQAGQGMAGAAENAAYTRGSAYIAQGNAIGNLLGSGMQAMGYYNANRTVQPSPSAVERMYMGKG